MEYIKPFGNTPLPIFERLVLGGGYSVRGYDLRSIGPQDPNSRIVIGGNKSLLFNAEYLIAVGGPVRLILFYDAGQVQNTGDPFRMKGHFKGGLERDIRARLHHVDGRRDPVLHAGAQRAVPVDFCVESAANRGPELQYGPAGKGDSDSGSTLAQLSKRGSFQMMRVSVAAVFSVMVLGASAFAQTPPPAAAVPLRSRRPSRMAFLDLQRIAAESTEGKAASSKVQALTQKKSAELQDKTKALQGNQQKLQQGAAVLNDAARAQTQKEIDRLTVEIDRFQEDANAEVQELQQSLQADFQEKLRPVVDAVVKELAIGLLFSAGDAGAIYVDPSLDITGEVIKRFDSGKYSTAAKPAAAPAAKPAACSGNTARNRNGKAGGSACGCAACRNAAAPPATQKPTPPAPAKP